MSKKVYLVDGSGYVFRAYYAVQPLSTNSGLPTNALFGFTRMLLKLLSEADSQHVAVVFDAGRETFRNTLYPAYKANRTECPADLVPQMPYFREISKGLGLTVLELPGYEADDIIGTLALKFSASGIETVIVTADKDLMQLVDGNVSIWDSMRDRHFGRSEVIDKFGVPPEKVVELLGLMGDSSDNIPGLKGVGPKTAVQLIEKFGDVETVIASIEELRADPSIRNRNKICSEIELNGELLRLSRKLVEIDTAVPLNFERNGQLMSVCDTDSEQLYGALERSGEFSPELISLFEKLEFTSLLDELKLASVTNETPRAEADYRAVLACDFQAFAREWAKQERFCFDLETTSLDPLKARIVGVALCWSANRAFYLPIAHADAGDVQQIGLDEFLQVALPIFSDPQILKVGQNLKYDISVMMRHGVEVRGTEFDTMVGSYLLNPDKGSHSLSTLARERLGWRMLEYTEVTKDCADFSAVSLEKATEYAAEDAHVAWLLAAEIAEDLEKHELRELFDTVDMPLVPVLARMELNGVMLDQKYLAGMSEELGAQLEQLKQRLYSEAGCEFNLNSPKQLSEVLFNRLGIPTKGLKKTKQGVSTDQSVLEKLSAHHVLPGLILEYRGLFKLKSTYVDALPSQISPVSGRLHSKFNQTVTGTGRLSSSDPNLQNIPIQTEAGRRVRAAFIAPSGMSLLSADYSQIELRILAHMSGDDNLITAFREGLDIHAATAREILGLSDQQELTSEMRRYGKLINFGVIYGMSGFRLARELGIPVNEGNRYIEHYFERFNGVRRFFDELESQAMRDGYVTTLLGRKRYMAGLDSRGRDAGFLMRAAINAPIQGTAADLVKLAMIKL
ncbi:MAG: DNA polymerase I, partial [Bdellovibrionales bacterium]|nr:DNA polymerase I [Bdellovibrionales bacterium]